MYQPNDFSKFCLFCNENIVIKKIMAVSANGPLLLLLLLFSFCLIQRATSSGMRKLCLFNETFSKNTIYIYIIIIIKRNKSTIKK